MCQPPTPRRRRGPAPSICTTPPACGLRCRRKLHHATVPHLVLAPLAENLTPHPLDDPLQGLAHGVASDSTITASAAGDALARPTSASDTASTSDRAAYSHRLGRGSHQPPAPSPPRRPPPPRRQRPQAGGVPPSRRCPRIRQHPAPANAKASGHGRSSTCAASHEGSGNARARGGIECGKTRLYACSSPPTHSGDALDRPRSTDRGIRAPTRRCDHPLIRGRAAGRSASPWKVAGPPRHGTSVARMHRTPDDDPAPSRRPPTLATGRATARSCACLHRSRPAGDDALLAGQSSSDRPPPTRPRAVAGHGRRRVARDLRSRHQGGHARRQSARATSSVACARHRRRRRSGPLGLEHRRHHARHHRRSRLGLRPPRRGHRPPPAPVRRGRRLEPDLALLRERPSAAPTSRRGSSRRERGDHPRPDRRPRPSTTALQGLEGILASGVHRCRTPRDARDWARPATTSPAPSPTS
jgi:hypothetical protein